MFILPKLKMPCVYILVVSNILEHAVVNIDMIDIKYAHVQVVWITFWDAD